MSSFNWLDLVCLIPAAVVLIAAVASITAARINKLPDAFARLEALMKVQDEHNRKVEQKLVAIYKAAVTHRDYGFAWEEWHADGMPGPPGKPERPDFIIQT